MNDKDQLFRVDADRCTRGSWRRRIVRFRRWGGFVIVIGASAVTIAACANAPSTPQVTELHESTTSTNGQSAASEAGRNSTTTTPSGSSATQLLNEWASCMRAHGDPNQADPTVDANGIIHISWNDPAIPGGYNGTNPGGQGNLGPGQHCRQYLSQAQTALGGGASIKGASQAQLLQFAQCMRANGIADYPDPVGGNLSFNQAAGGDLNLSNPTFQSASKACVQKTGVHVPGSSGGPPSGSIELNGVTPPGASGVGGNG
jgi:hypothetical protein